MALFKAVNAHLPKYWEFSYLAGRERESEELLTTETARWGYHEIVHSEKHNIGLIEREYEDLRIFYLEQQKFRGRED